jgi:IS30 family transposase
LRSSRSYLSPAEREDVKRLYATKKYSVRKLAQHFGVGKSTIGRVIKETEEESIKQSVQRRPVKTAASKEVPSKAPAIAPGELVPKLEFRMSKLEEIKLDLHACRMRGQMNIIPQLHRIHLSTYDEVQSLVEKQQEIESNMENKGLVAQILSTINQLPPVLKQQIEEELLTKDVKVLSFPKVENDE